MDLLWAGTNVQYSDLSILIVVSAFLLGALHALEPGHGKSIMAVFVMGTDADVKDALLLGLTIVFSHVIVVMALGVASIYLIEALDVDLTHDIMSLLGGMILIGVGVWILRKFYHPHEHIIDTRKGVIAIGLSTGLIPCPAALAILLFSISNNQVYNGLLYVLVFSIGLAVAITSLSIVFVKGKGFLEGYVGSKSISRLPLVSGSVIILIGLFTLLHPILDHLAPGVHI
ncbi:MAG: nickel/cobalt transporter (NicO) family protein [Methanolobus sp.]|jgi:ABC-type nickel/cobalt efflux system permease component RcnA|nr:nickel/cobalt transporter (NicO) family protein [Methanolobus sp.]MDK2833238.1 nickel/cobalt transporter (NicO) family protein [Methanolobus sp.]MDK2911088.1 nickel/cobalt transporter (NicO) family protein [Methanolobus sp.]MDN5309035.1 nickel/cobalt transporter (NicO) family protein [Methanolobus sp.]